MFFHKKLKKPDPEAEERLNKQINDEGGIGGKDLFAMIMSAYIVIIPIALGFLLLIYLLARLFIGI